MWRERLNTVKIKKFEEIAGNFLIKDLTNRVEVCYKVV